MESYLKNITLDWAKVGTMLTVSHLLSGGSVNDPEWIKSSLFTLLGFSAYEGLVSKFVNASMFGEKYEPLVHTVLKVLTMLVVSRLLAGGSLTDQDWIKSSLFTIAGFAVYVLFIHRRLTGHQFTDNPDLANSLDDAVNFGTMFLVSRTLSGQSLSDRSWVLDSLYTIAGFAVYDLGVSRVVAMLGHDPHSGRLPAHTEHHSH